MESARTKLIKKKKYVRSPIHASPNTPMEKSRWANTYARQYSLWLSREEISRNFPTPMFFGTNSQSLPLHGDFGMMEILLTFNVIPFG